MASKKILVVDDEPSNLEVLKGILESSYELSFAKDGKTALEVVGKNKPDLILLDIMMPNMDGYEVCRRIKADPETLKIPVIFVTTMDGIQDEARGFKLGAVDYIIKPVSPAIVKARVRAHLGLVQVEALNDLVRASIQMLGEAGHYNDNDTGEHIWRMAAYSRAIAEAAGWSSHQAAILELAAPLHDTGKIGIPDSIATLDLMKGDCNEHAVLFAALCRAAGIPARIAAGVTYHKNAFYYHAWNEVCVGGNWFSLDTTVNQLPADLGHIRFVVGGTKEQIRIGALLGKLKIDPVL